VVLDPHFDAYAAGIEMIDADPAFRPPRRA
jgi:hypothetical protein